MVITGSYLKKRLCDSNQQKYINDDATDLDLDLEVAELVDQFGNIQFKQNEDKDSEEEVNNDLDEDIKDEELQLEDLVEESKVDDAGPSDPKVVQEI
jgi:predicted phage-related endonuclease